MSSVLRPRVWAVLAGLLLLQLGWILAVPPFGGIDEHDHAMKAAAVARGDFSPHHPPSISDRAEMLTVPEGLAKAGEPECLVLAYTYYDNCVGTNASNGSVRIASSAARYNPAYYAVIGTLGRWFTGDTSLYAMRAASSLACASLFVAAFVIAWRTSRSAWPVIASLLALTPTGVYTSVLVAPNGIEIAGGLLLWTCLTALGAEERRGVSDRTLLLLASAASVPLLAVRTLGCLWWVLVVAGAVLTIGVPRARQVVRGPGARVFAFVCTAAGIYGAAWFVIARSNGFVHDAPNPGSPWPGMWLQWVLWFFQTIAAAPLRNNYVPTVVYAVGISAVTACLVLALKVADRRMRWVLLYIVCTASIIAIAASVVTYSGSGYSWQGRYFYPFTIGFFVVLGRILDKHRTRVPIHPAFASALAGATLFVTQVCSQVAVGDFEGRVSLLPVLGLWHPPSHLALIVLALVGSMLLAGATVTTRPRSLPDGTPREAHDGELVTTLT